MTRRAAPFLLSLLLAGCDGGASYAPKGTRGQPFACYGPRGETAPVAAAAPAGVPESSGGMPTHPRGLKAPDPIVFNPAPIAPALLKNGVKVFVAEDRAVPLVSVTLYLRTGVLEEPETKAGLADLAGDAMRAGGAGDWDPDALDELLEGMAASVECEIGTDQGTLSLSCRVQDLDKGLEVLKAVLERPRFDEARLNMVKARALEGIRRRRDDPEALAVAAFRRLLYGAGSPWARESTQASVAALTREDVAAFHAEHIRPCLWSAAVAGDLDAGEAVRRMEAAFGSFPRREGAGPALPPEPAILDPRVVLVPKPVDQASLFVGHAGPSNLQDGQPHPDRYAIQVFNFILGGGSFTSRLVKEIRVTRGLAYSAWSAFSMHNGRGAVQMGCQTRTDKATESLACMKEVLRKALDGGVTEEELALAKDSMVHAFVFKVATPALRAQNAASFDYMGFPADYLSHYVARIQAVTVEDVARVAKAHCHPDRMSIAVCGSSEGLEKPLAAFGRVEVETVGE